MAQEQAAIPTNESGDSEPKADAIPVVLSLTPDAAELLIQGMTLVFTRARANHRYATSKGAPAHQVEKIGVYRREMESSRGIIRSVVESYAKHKGVVLDGLSEGPVHALVPVVSPVEPPDET